MKTIAPICAILICTSNAMAQNLEESWAPLENELSRSQLLQLAAPIQSTEAPAIPSTFVFPTDTVKQNSIFGIDISHYTPSNVPLNQLNAQNIHHVYVKATQGVGFKDPKFAQFWGGLGKLPENEKVFRGAYHFLSSSDDPVQQADRFVAYVNLNGGFKNDDLPPVMDLEWDKASATAPDKWKNHKPAAIVAAALAFLNRVQQLTGKVPMIYTARSWWVDAGIPESQFIQMSRFPVWIADYSKSSLSSEKPAVPNKAKLTIWQFSESAKLTGSFKNGLDANIFYGTDEEFLSTFNLTPL